MIQEHELCFQTAGYLQNSTHWSNIPWDESKQPH